MNDFRKVTEQDFRKPEFRNKDPEDYEFRADGKIVRKDRWETGIHRIVSALGMDVREFEIDDVVYAVKTLVNQYPDREDPDDYEEDGGNSENWDDD
jgi:hypothetical protein